VGFWGSSRASAAAVMAPILQGSRVTPLSARQVLLSRAFARSAGARSALIRVLRARNINHPVRKPHCRSMELPAKSASGPTVVRAYACGWTSSSTQNSSLGGPCSQTRLLTRRILAAPA
jgi:hypothetical protein